MIYNLLIYPGSNLNYALYKLYINIEESIKKFAILKYISKT